MKRIALICVSIFVITNLIYPQDIINETGKNGKFIVRDNAEKESLVIDEGEVSITGALKIEDLGEGTLEDKIVVWSEDDKKFKALYNMIPNSTINASILAADSWAEDGSGNIYRSTGYVGIGTTTPTRPLDIQPSVSGSAQLMRESDSDLFAINMKSLSNRGEILLYKDGAKTTKLTGFGDTYFNSGNVGIGTDTPSRLLTIHDPTFSYASFQTPSSGTTSGDGLTIGYSNGGGLIPGAARILNNENTSLHFGTNNTNRVAITKDGNVGIGTESPATKLHMYDAASGAGALLIQNSATGTTEIGSEIQDGLFMGYSGSDAFLWNYENTSLHFGTNSTNRMAITEAGNIGIGTTTPSEALTVKVGGTSWTSPHFALEASGSTNKWDFTVGSSNGLFIGYNETTKIGITDDGRVGIGESIPSAKLEVKGDVILGENGSRFMEIREITGTTNNGAYTEYADKLPVGWDGDDTRILSIEVMWDNYSWEGAGSPGSGLSVAGRVFPSSRNFGVHYPPVSEFHGMPWRAMIMRMP